MKAYGSETIAEAEKRLGVNLQHTSKETAAAQLNTILIELMKHGETLERMMVAVCELREDYKKVHAIKARQPTKVNAKKPGRKLKGDTAHPKVKKWECGKCGHKHTSVIRPVLCTGCKGNRVTFTEVKES